MSDPAGNLHQVSGGEVLVRARGLTKRFGTFTAVDGIDFDLYRGEAFGFLGPNGAGKSSTMRMIGCVSLRALTLGGAGPGLLWRAGYLAAVGLAGLYVSGRRIAKLLLV
jgi:ABC-type iron transport system FetAB ATPase subunit